MKVIQLTKKLMLSDLIVRLKNRKNHEINQIGQEKLGKEIGYETK